MVNWDFFFGIAKNLPFRICSNKDLAAYHEWNSFYTLAVEEANDGLTPGFRVCCMKLIFYYLYRQL